MLIIEPQTPTSPTQAVLYTSIASPASESTMATSMTVSTPPRTFELPKDLGSLIVGGAIALCLSAGVAVGLAFRRRNQKRANRRAAVARGVLQAQQWDFFNTAGSHHIATTDTEPASDGASRDAFEIFRKPLNIYHARSYTSAGVNDAVSPSKVLEKVCVDGDVRSGETLQGEEKGKLAAATEVIHQIDVEYRMRSFCFAEEMAKAKRKSPFV
ncbi:hypothetical protein HGRIS_010690 [Hohenbuehelia grisea]|uniref:Uncharacterized protein n=1 Tax=Hohenbuehelia grisea TaxID=104357 RepID=A0ABR3IXN4_9AGAR